MSKLLERVTGAAEERESADRNYRKAITAARKKHTLEEIGRAAGTSKQAVWNYLNYEARKGQT